MKESFVVPREELERLVFLATTGAIVWADQVDHVRAQADAVLVLDWRARVGLEVLE